MLIIIFTFVLASTIASSQTSYILGPTRAAWRLDDWTPVNDQVRGGRSISAISVIPTSSNANDTVSACFHGIVDTTALGNAGFASQRFSDPDYFRSLGVNNYTGILITTASTDNRQYSLNLYRKPYNNSMHRGQKSQRQVEFKAYFNGTSTNSITGVNMDRQPLISQLSDMHKRVELPWTAFQPYFNGRPIKNAVHLFPHEELVFDPASVVALSVMCASGFNKQHGPFSASIMDIQLVPAEACS